MGRDLRLISTMRFSFNTSVPAPTWRFDRDVSGGADDASAFRGAPERQAVPLASSMSVEHG